MSKISPIYYEDNHASHYRLIMFIINEMAKVKRNTKKYSIIIGNPKKKKTTKNVVNINLSVEEA